ncbi:pyridoxal-phosphate-dependent aminotransferase family protein [Ammonifex thiophilus]|uniref:Alanine--glyoxylate aminotransferase family protein n=1 Tax=Ammonifex thiophilus TaxID=444093 RepID=A0A3D8P7Q5_9THEO|nr:alanine--glyoxylate aminotransferase family protein [Ammonifex thiophilus]RDV84565.1 alanine--glyoxylate aminotransferase family protein [Ammonifex thiophilus]
MRKETRLFIPGPTPVPPAVAEAMARPLIGHRTEDFAQLYARLEERLRVVLGTKSDIVILTSSGTGGMEAAVANLVSPGDPVLALVTGKFGERFAELAKVYGGDVEVMEFGWGNTIDLEAVEGKLKARRFKVVLATHNETSTTVVNDIRGLGELTRRYGALLVVDAVSSAGGMEIRMDEWGVDVLVTASQKALMVPPGLAIVAASETAWKAMEESKSPRYYLDLLAARKSKQKYNTPYTPAVSLFVGLDRALELILAEGLEKVYRKHRLLARAVRAAVRALGLELMVPDEYASPVVTGVWAPESIEADRLRKEIASRYGVLLAGGQGPLKGRIFRIAHMGYVDAVDILGALGALELGLYRFGFKFKLGEGLAQAQAVLAKEGEE